MAYKALHSAIRWGKPEYEAILAITPSLLESAVTRFEFGPRASIYRRLEGDWNESQLARDLKRRMRGPQDERNGNRPIHLAAQNGHLEITQKLIRQRATCHLTPITRRNNDPFQTT